MPEWLEGTMTPEQWQDMVDTYGDIAKDAQPPDIYERMFGQGDASQPLDGRTNRNNANLDSVALGQAGINAGTPAGPPPRLPPEVETIEDYRRLMETGSVAGDAGGERSLIDDADTPELSGSAYLSDSARHVPPTQPLARVGPGDVGGADDPKVDDPKPETGTPGEGDPGDQQTEQPEPTEADLAPFMPRLVNQPGPEDDASYDKRKKVVEKKAREAFIKHQKDMQIAANKKITQKDINETMPPGIASPPVAQTSADAIAWHKRWNHARERAIKTEVEKLAEDKNRAKEAEGFDWKDVEAILPSTNFPIKYPADVDKWYKLRGQARDKAIDHLEKVQKHKETVKKAGFKEADIKRVMLDIPPAGDIDSTTKLNSYFGLREASRGYALKALETEAAAKKYAEAHGLDWQQVQGNLHKVAPPEQIKTPEDIRRHYANVKAGMERTIRKMIEEKRERPR
jgi:hypothetical protein